MRIVLACLGFLLPGLAWWIWGGNRNKDAGEALAGIFGISASVITLGTLFFYTIRVAITPLILGLIFGAFFGLVFIGLIKHGKTSFNLTWLLALLGFGVVLTWRLWQARDLLLPNWVDSLHHVLIVRKMIEAGGLTSTLEPYLPGPFYYHYAFHAVSALFSVFSGLDPAQSVLIFGQVISAGVSLSIYALAKSLSRDWRVSLLAGIFVTFVTRMPGYYLTWGRYTLLMGVFLLPLAVAEILRFRAPGTHWHSISRKPARLDAISRVTQSPLLDVRLEPSHSEGTIPEAVQPSQDLDLEQSRLGVSTYDPSTSSQDSDLEQSPPGVNTHIPSASSQDLDLEQSHSGVNTHIPSAFSQDLVSDQTHLEVNTPAVVMFPRGLEREQTLPDLTPQPPTSSWMRLKQKLTHSNGVSQTPTSFWMRLRQKLTHSKEVFKNPTTYSQNIKDNQAPPGVNTPIAATSSPNLESEQLPSDVSSQSVASRQQGLKNIQTQLVLTLKFSAVNWRSLLTLAVLTAGTLLSHYLCAFQLAVFYLLVGVVLVRSIVQKRLIWGQILALVVPALVGLILAARWYIRIFRYSTVTSGVLANVVENSATKNAWDYLAYLTGPLSGHILIGLAIIGLIWLLIKNKTYAFTFWGLLIGFLALPTGFRLAGFRNDYYGLIVFLCITVAAAWAVVSIVEMFLRKRLHKSVVSSIILLIGLAFGVWGGVLNQDAINDETVLVTKADIEALNWIEDHLPEDARFFINTTAWGYGVHRGVDGGAWIMPITGRWSLVPTIFYPFGRDEEYITQINDFGARAHSITTCGEEFWFLITDAKLNYLYNKDGSGSLRPAALQGCEGLIKLYDNDGVSIWLADP